MDINKSNPRIKLWNKFIADQPYTVSEKYRKMRDRLVEHIRNSGKPISPEGAAEVIVAVAEWLGEVEWRYRDRPLEFVRACREIIRLNEVIEGYEKLLSVWTKDDDMEDAK